jgi:hypothetical protein
MTQFRRMPLHRYEDPLARVWRTCAERTGFRIERSPDVYASTDGLGTLFIGTDEILDPDDSLAQMILHELCHALVEGEEGERLPDWGLDNTTGRHTWRERACLRLQAYLTAAVGLRQFFAPTTDFRVSFWNSLPDDPFSAPAEAGGRRERSCVAARIAAWRASQPRWQPHLQVALEASAAIAGAVARATESAAEVEETDGAGLPSLWRTVAPAPARHPCGNSFVASYHVNQTCASCAWRHESRGVGRCRHAPAVRLAADTPACARWEAADELDCRTCGACCREAYHSVEISAREPLNRVHPALVVIEPTHRKLRRDGDRCAALLGGNSAVEPYACAVYEDRPRTCREFPRGSANCLDARRRVGLSL